MSLASVFCNTYSYVNWYINMPNTDISIGSRTEDKSLKIDKP